MKPHTLFRKPVDDSEGAPAVIFLHGLGGSPATTWAKMFKCFSADVAFQSYALDCYQFPTRLLRLPFTAPLPGLRDIAEGLKTFIEEKHGNRQSVALVAHSLGGLVARQYLVSEFRSEEKTPVNKLALIAVPSTGSTLANVGSQISFTHFQLKNLTKNNSALNDLNIDWEKLKIERSIDVRYILGGCDRVVPHNSSLPFVDRENKSMLIDADHRSIVCPESSDDIRFLTVKRFLLTPQPTIRSASPERGAKSSQLDTVGNFVESKPDPLFDIYLPQDELYYISRDIDTILLETLGSSHVWLVGYSGVGKTAALRRVVYQNSWHLNQITLAGYEARKPIEVFRALCIELGSLSGIETVPPAGAGTADLFLFLKKVLKGFPPDLVIANVVEEMPLDKENLAHFGDLLALFLASLTSEKSLLRRVRFALSSLHDVTQSREPMGPKTREFLQIIPMQPWGAKDLHALVDLLAAAMKPQLTLQDKLEIISSAAGSPRFVKQVFRHWRNGTSNGDALPTLLARVTAEQMR